MDADERQRASDDKERQYAGQYRDMMRQYENPTLRDLAPEGFKWYETIVLHLLLITFVVLGCLGVWVIMISAGSMWGKEPLYFTVPVLVSGVATVVSAISLSLLILRAQRRLSTVRETDGFKGPFR